MSGPTDGESTPGGFGNPRFLIAAGVVVLIVVLGLGLTFFGGNDDDPTPPQATGTTAPATSDSSTPSTSADGECDLPAGDQTIPVTTPQGTEWELLGRVAVPTAPDTIGPAVTDEDTGLRSCFADSPLGALYAGVNFLVASSAPDTQRAAYEQLTVPGDAQQRALELVKASPATAVQQRGLQIAGFTFLSFTKETSTIELAVSGGNGGLASVTIPLTWDGKDWRFVIPPDGLVNSLTQPLPNLTGYVPWSGA